MKRILSSSAEETRKLAAGIGQRLRGGEVIELASDLGGGKTTFVHGLSKGAGSKDKVASPTFTLSRLYKAPDFDIHHLDFYRLPDTGLMEYELSDIVGDPKVVTVVEWAGIARHVLPKGRLTIKFTRTGENSRRLELNYPESLNYLVENL